jgi:MFS family permease
MFSLGDFTALLMDISITNAIIGGISGVLAATLPPVIAFYIAKWSEAQIQVPTALKPWRWLTIVAFLAALLALVIALWPHTPGPHFEADIVDIPSAVDWSKPPMQSKTVLVKFKQPFRTQPTVVIGISGLDVTTGVADETVRRRPDGSERQTLRVAASVSGITKEGFRFSIDAPNAITHGGHANWFAFEQ